MSQGHRGWVEPAAVAHPLTTLAVLAAGAGAVWYGRKRLAEASGGSPASPAPTPASTPPPAPAPAPPAPGAVASPPAAEVAQPAPAEPPEPVEVPHEPEIEPREVPAVADEPPPLAFEDAHQEGWQDEELRKDPAVVDELESDPATQPDAELDLARESEKELPEPAPEPDVVPPRTDPGHVTRVVDDLLEGRRDDAEHEPIEDDTAVEQRPPLVEEDPEER